MAVWRPTPETVERYYRLQQIALEKGGLFADHYRRLTWTNPDLDYTVRRPVTEVAKHGWTDDRLADRDLFLRGVSSRPRAASALAARRYAFRRLARSIGRLCLLLMLSLSLCGRIDQTAYTRPCSEPARRMGQIHTSRIRTAVAACATVAHTDCERS